MGDVKVDTLRYSLAISDMPKSATRPMPSL